jgi:hypothetical protein
VPGTRVTDAQRRKFFQLHLNIDGPHLPMRKAAERCGFSMATASRLIKGLRESSAVDERRTSSDLPNPKSWDELSTDARDALRDIHVFRELFGARRRQVWVYDAAMRVVDALADETQRTFLDINVFPGAGKTFLCMDVGAWLVAGGGFCDPRRGRALRIMYGSEVMRTATHMVNAVRNFLTLRRPYYDMDQDRSALLVMAEEYGRFRPLRGYDPDTQWTAAQFVVAQMAEMELYEKEPTIQAASFKSGFLGERVNVAFWDDIATTKNSLTPDAAEAVNVFFANEAERRPEPGGVLALVGQRLTPIDLHRKRLDVRRRDGTPLYQHIIYPAHHDALCDGNHRQWEGRYEVGAGCMTDEWRLPVADWDAVSEGANYRTVFQQEDADPEAVLVQPAWLYGETDLDGFESPGCYDEHREFGRHPGKEVGALIEYATVDPSPTQYWAIEWWAYQPKSRFNYLIWGERRKMAAGKLLDWNNADQVFTGLMEEIQMASVIDGHPIRCWVLEVNVAQRFLLEFEHYRRWRRRWPDVAVIKHQTQMNKLDPRYGTSILSSRYKTGFKRLPNMAGTGVEGRNFMRVLAKELTSYPFAETDDTVLADWMGEFNLPRIVAAARRQPGEGVVAKMNLPPYLARQRHEIALASGGR